MKQEKIPAHADHDWDETEFDFEDAIVNQPGEDLVKTVRAAQTSN